MWMVTLTVVGLIIGFAVEFRFIPDGGPDALIVAGALAAAGWFLGSYMDDRYNRRS